MERVPKHLESLARAIVEAADNAPGGSVAIIKVNKNPLIVTPTKKETPAQAAAVVTEALRAVSEKPDNRESQDQAEKQLNKRGVRTR